MKLLLRCDQTIHAAHLVNVLRAAGIRAQARNVTLSGALGEIPWLECAPQVWILDDLEWHRALAILADLQRPHDGVPWTCAGCGQGSDAQFTECWRCGELRPA